MEIRLKLQETIMKVVMYSMNDLLRDAKQEIETLWNHVSEGKHIKTGDIRKLSAQLFRGISDKNIKNVFALCDEFLEEHNWELGVIAFDWAFRMKRNYDKETYQVFYGWLKNMLGDGEIVMIFVRMHLESCCDRINHYLHI